jgi:hypothetical protein
VTEGFVVVRRCDDGRLHMVTQWTVPTRAEAEDTLERTLLFLRKNVRHRYRIARVRLVPYVDEDTADIATPRRNRQPVYDWSAVE